MTLSACQTAISDFGDLPDEVIGLPAGFLQAGAVGVLGSLWPVDDLSTALFMDHFYLLHRGNGTDGLEPAAALQATQRWLRCLTVAELSDLFADYRAAAPDVPTGRMAYALAQEKYVNFTLAENQDMTPYADPYYWAAFCFLWDVTHPFFIAYRRENMFNKPAPEPQPYAPTGTTTPIYLPRGANALLVKPGESYFVIKVHSAQAAFYGSIWERVNQLLITTQVSLNHRLLGTSR